MQWVKRRVKHRVMLGNTEHRTAVCVTGLSHLNFADTVVPYFPHKNLSEPT